MATTKKAQALAATIADELLTRIPGLASPPTGFTAASLVQGSDTDGNPYILIGDGTAGHGNVIIKVMPQPWPLALDALGNSAIQYTPHQVEVGWEAVSGAGADPLTTAGKLLVFGCVALRGTKVLTFESATGTAPWALVSGSYSGQLIAANQVSTFSPDPQYPLVSDQ